MSISEKQYLVSVSSPVLTATIIEDTMRDVVVVPLSNLEVTLKTDITITVDA